MSSGRFRGAVSSPTVCWCSVPSPAACALPLLLSVRHLLLQEPQLHHPAYTQVLPLLLIALWIQHEGSMKSHCHLLMATLLIHSGVKFGYVCVICTCIYNSHIIDVQDVMVHPGITVVIFCSPQSPVLTVMATPQHVRFWQPRASVNRILCSQPETAGVPVICATTLVLTVTLLCNHLSKHSSISCSHTGIHSPILTQAYWYLWPGSLILLPLPACNHASILSHTPMQPQWCSVHSHATMLMAAESLMKSHRHSWILFCNQTDAHKYCLAKIFALTNSGKRLAI